MSNPLFSQKHVEIEGALIIKKSMNILPKEGMIRFNSNTKDFEGFNGFYWVTLTGGVSFEVGTVSDVDGNEYETIKIGNQWWMLKNLNVGSRINGTETQSNNSIIEKYCYDDVESNCDIYGGLYLWSEMMQYSITEGSQGICPDGWHIPTDTEWTNLIFYLDSETNTDINLLGPQSNIAGGKMKEIDITHWNEPNVGATNESTFSALPGGYHDPTGEYGFLGDLGYWWSSSLTGASAWMRYLNRTTTDVYRNENPNPGIGFSVRCIKD